MPSKRKPMPSGDFLRAHLRYDPDTGLLYRRSTGALATKYGQKYPRVSLMQVYYYAHRIIWRMEISEEVPFEIDHFNENKNDNRLENFRSASHFENMWNKRKSKNNTSGYKGVSWHKWNKKWQSRITLNHKRLHLGHFDDPASAHRAYVEAAVNLHGEFANDGNGPIR